MPAVSRPLLLTLVAALAACSDPTGPDPRSAFEAARQRWQGSGVLDYRMTVLRVCECPPAITGAVVVVARGGEVVGVSDAVTAEPLAEADAAFFLSVDELFQRIEEFLDQGVEVEATYDPVFGFPIHLFVDPVPGAIDDEVGWEISGFEPGAGSEQQAALNAARGKWGAEQFRDYDLDLRRSCACEPGLEGTVKVRVRGGVVVSRTFAPQGEPVAEEHAPAYPSVAGLFDVVQDALDRGAAALAVEYEPNLGFPEAVTIDYRAGLEGEEIEYEVVKLVRVAGGVE